jgi:hypothetical protein
LTINTLEQHTISAALFGVLLYRIGVEIARTHATPKWLLWSQADIQRNRETRKLQCVSGQALDWQKVCRLALLFAARFDYRSLHLAICSK